MIDDYIYFSNRPLNLEHDCSFIQMQNWEKLNNLPKDTLLLNVGARTATQSSVRFKGLVQARCVCVYVCMCVCVIIYSKKIYSKNLCLQLDKILTNDCHANEDREPFYYREHSILPQLPSNPYLSLKTQVPWYIAADSCLFQNFI